MSTCTHCDGEGRWERDVFSPALGHGTVPETCSRCDGTGEEPAPVERCMYAKHIRQEAMRRLVRRGRGWSPNILNRECRRVCDDGETEVWR